MSLHSPAHRQTRMSVPRGRKTQDKGQIQVLSPPRPINGLMEASIYRMRQQDVLTVCVLALLALGAVMVQSASVSLTGCVVRGTSPHPAAPPPPGPAAVADVTAATGPGGIDLTWSPDPAPAVVAYRVYRTEV